MDAYVRRNPGRMNAHIADVIEITLTLPRKNTSILTLPPGSTGPTTAGRHGAGPDILLPEQAKGFVRGFKRDQTPD
jgi:hypothetical protein